MRLEDLKPGHRFDPLNLTLTADDAAAYAAATGDESPLAASQVPPMAVIARGLSHIIEALELGEGAVHASQEVAFEQPVQTGQPLRVEMGLRANSVRRAARFLTVESNFFDEAAHLVARSVSTVVVAV